MYKCGRGNLWGVLTAKHAPFLCQTATLGVDTLGLALLDALGLVEGDTQGLGAHAGGLGVLGLAGLLLSLAGAHILDLVLAFLRETVGDHADVLAVQGGSELLPVGDDLAVRAVLVIGALEKVTLDGLQESRDRGRQLGDRDGGLAVLAGDVTTSGRDEVAGGLAGAELDAQGHTAELPLVELPARGVALAQIADGADTRSGKNRDQAVDLGVQLLALLVRGLGGNADRDDDGLGLSDTGREHKATVVTVDHNHDTQGTGRETPGVLPNMDRGLLLVTLGGGILDGDVEHLAEVLPKTVRGTTLDTTASGGNVALHGGGVGTTGKLLLLRLLTLDHGNGQELLIDAGVQVQNLDDLLMGSILGQMSSVALLPQELTGSQERLGVLELPSHNGVPLVELEGKVTVTSDPLGIVWVHDGFRSRADSNLPLQGGGATAKDSHVSVPYENSIGVYSRIVSGSYA